MKTSNNRGKYTLFLIPVIILVVYTGIIPDGRIRTYTNRYNYFKDLAISFSQGRLDVDSPYPPDLVSFKGKHYLYWPPAPALVYMPFTALWARTTPDTFIVSCFGALNVFLLMVLLNLFSRRYELKLNRTGIAFLAVFWGLGTVHFYMSMIGAVWYISQIMAQTFLMLSLVFILLNTSLTTLFLSGLFYSMAVYSKNDLVFAIFLIGAIYITKDKFENRKTAIRNIMVFLAPFIVFSLANLAYNQARFGNAFENGTNYHRMNPRFTEDFSKYGYLSLHYVPNNFVREVIMPPPFTRQYPFIKLDPEGFGLLWASPVFIFIFAAAFYYACGSIKHIFRRQAKHTLSQDDLIVMSGAAVSGILTAFIIFMVMGTGWAQFASRYSLDYQLMILLFGVFIIKIWNKNKIFNTVLIILLFISIYMNYFGMRFYLHSFEKYYYQHPDYYKQFENTQSKSSFEAPSAVRFHYSA